MTPTPTARPTAPATASEALARLLARLDASGILPEFADDLDLIAAALPARRRRRARRPIETSDYAAMLRRMLGAYGRRVADADDVDLAELVELRRDLDTAISDAVVGQRATHGRSWADIGRAVGMTRQSAQQRWGGATA